MRRALSGVFALPVVTSLFLFLVEGPAAHRQRRADPGRRSARNVGATLLLTALLAPMSWGQGPVPAGDEFQINTQTIDRQREPGIARLAGGDFVVVWDSQSSSGSDTSLQSIQGQRYDSQGQALGAEFQVNTFTTDIQRTPEISGLADGGFVIVWRSYLSASDTWSKSIQGQRYAADGSALGAQFQANSYTSGSQSRPSVAGLGGGDFVVVWNSDRSVGDSGHSIQGQRYASGGGPVGAQLQINSYTTDVQVRPSVAALAGGGFVTVWQSRASSGTDSWSDSIQGRVFDAAGEPIADDFQINDYTPEFQWDPAVAGLADGGFVAVWGSRGSDGLDVSQFSIQGRRYDAVGSAPGMQFEINTYTARHQTMPAVAGEPGGGFVVAWQSDGSSATDASETSIHARRFGAGGEALGGDFQVNAWTGLDQEKPAVATMAGGGFVAVWHSEGSSGSDVSAFSIQGQRFADPRFALTGLAGKCLDVEGGGGSPESSRASLAAAGMGQEASPKAEVLGAGASGDGTPVNLYRCTGGANQVWRLDLTAAPQPVVGLGGKCLVPGPVDPSGDTRVVIGGCSEGDDVSDRWQLITTGAAPPSVLIHHETGLCLDVEGSTSDDGTPTILFECHGGANQVWRPVPEVCTRDSLGLCLTGERFRVELEWTSFDGTTGSGQAVPVGSGDSGLMWFFEADNWELLVKVLDGCAINDRLWVFAAATTTVEYTLRVTDTALGTVAEYFNPLGAAAAAITDTDAFATCDAPGAAPPTVAKAVPARVASLLSAGDTALKGDCVPSPTAMCLSGGRFAVEVAWRDYAGNTGSGRVVAQQSLDSGLFYFFDVANWEMLVKVLDACDVPPEGGQRDTVGRFWLLAAATTDVEYTLRVTDTGTGIVREYFNPLGNAAAALVDTFETCP